MSWLLLLLVLLHQIKPRCTARKKSRCSSWPYTASATVAVAKPANALLPTPNLVGHHPPTIGWLASPRQERWPVQRLAERGVLGWAGGVVIIVRCGRRPSRRATAWWWTPPPPRSARGRGPPYLPASLARRLMSVCVVCVAIDQGSGGRSMWYVWTVTSPTGADTSNITAYLATINANTVRTYDLPHPSTTVCLPA